MDKNWINPEERQNIIDELSEDFTNRSIDISHRIPLGIMVFLRDQYQRMFDNEGNEQFRKEKRDIWEEYARVLGELIDNIDSLNEEYEKDGLINPGYNIVCNKDHSPKSREKLLNLCFDGFSDNSQINVIGLSEFKEYYEYVFIRLEEIKNLIENLINNSCEIEMLEDNGTLDRLRDQESQIEEIEELKQYEIIKNILDEIDELRNIFENSECI